MGTKDHEGKPQWRISVEKGTIFFFPPFVLVYFGNGIRLLHDVMQVITQIAVVSGKWNTRVLDSLLKTR